MTSEQQGVALCLTSALGFGTTAILAKLAYDADFSVLPLLALRFTFSGALLFLLIGHRRPVRRTLLAGFALGFCVISVQAGLLFAAFSRIDASLAVVLHYSYPALVVAAALLLGREALSGRRLGALGLALAGVVLVLAAAGIGSVDALGVACALGSAVSYSAYVLLADGMVAGCDPFLLAALISAGAGLAFTAVVPLSGSELEVAPLGWLWLAALVLTATVLPLVAFLGGLSRIGPSSASILSTLEPVTTVALAFVIFGERLSAVQLVGATLVLGAVLVLASPPRVRSNQSL